MAYKFQMSQALLSGTIEPSLDDTYSLGSAGAKWQDIYIDGTAHLDAINYNGTLVSATAAELNYLDNDDLSAADLQKLADVTSTAAELNYVDTTAGTAAASKAVVLNAGGGTTGIVFLTASFFSGNGSGITNIDVGNLDATGIDTQVQFNQNGEFGANSGLTYNGSGSLATTVALSSVAISGSGALTAGGVVTAGNGFFTVSPVGAVDINSGAIDGTIIGASAVAAGSFAAVVGTTGVYSAGLSATSISGSGALSAGGVVTAGNGFFTVSPVGAVDINSGAIDGTIIGASAVAAGSFAAVVGTTGVYSAGLTATTISGSGAATVLNVTTDKVTAATVDLNGGNIDGTIIGAASVAAGSFAAVVGTTGVYSAGLTATTISGSGALSSFGNLSVANARMVFDGADLTLAAGTRIVAVDAEFSGVLTLSGTSDHPVAVATDSIYYLDATSGKLRRDSFADLATAMAGPGLTATGGVLSSDASPTPNDIGNANAVMVEGFNYSSVVFNAPHSWTTPASPDAGDRVIVKAPSNALTYPLTIVGNAPAVIDGVSSIQLESNDGAVTLTYVGSNKWMIS